MTHWWITPPSSRARWPPPCSSASPLASGPVSLPVLPAGGAADHGRHHAGRGDPHDSPASEARGGPTPDCSSACPPRSLCVVLPLTVRGGRQRVPAHAGSWMPAARVGSSACGLFARGRWVERADGPASCPHPQRVPRLRVCRTPCLGSVLHAHKLLHQFLAARPCPAGALRSASSVASAFVSISASSAHRV